MQIRSTYAELEAAAEKRYERWVASLPTPKVINVQALVAFSAPRKFVWGGVGYRAPPLPFLAGMRLFIAANALRDLRSAWASPATQQHAASTAVEILRTLIHPQRLIDRLRPWVRPFVRSSPEELETLLRWLLHVADEAKVQTNATQVTIDYMAVLTDFVREFPAWVGPDGFPLTWSLYIYGSRHIPRARAREDLRRAYSMRAAAAPPMGYRMFNHELTPVAGWNNG